MMAVVVDDVLAKDNLQLSAAEDQHPVQ